MARNMPHPATLAAQALGWIDEQTGAVVLPVHTATTFLRDPDNEYRRGRNYARADNASYDQPEALITALEGGAASLVFASGMAAAAAVFHSLPPGSHVVAPVVMYHSLRRWIAARVADEHFAADFVDIFQRGAAGHLHRRIVPQQLLDRIRRERRIVPQKLKLVWIAI